MNDASVWIATTIPVAAVVATTYLNNRFGTRGRESQQKHDEKLRMLDHSNAQRRALTDLKLAAYSDVLSEVGVAEEKRKVFIDSQTALGISDRTYYPGDLTSAASRAKLLLRQDRQKAFDDTMTDFYQSKLTATGPARNGLVKLFAQDMGLDE